MKRLLFCLLLCFFLLCKNVSAKEAEEKNFSPALSPAIHVLREKERLRKGNLFGCRIDFSENDFELIFCEKEFSGIEILSLPSPEAGILQWQGMSVEIGQRISKDSLADLSLIPCSQNTGTYSFQYRGIEENHEIRICELFFGENENTPLDKKNFTTETFANVSVEITVNTDLHSETFFVTENAKNGILSADERKGTITYQPKTDFHGKDRFTICRIDCYGNRIEEQEIAVTVKKSNDNLFFSDLAGKNTHYYAVYVCNNKWMDYDLDENQLPIFHPQEKMDYNDFLQVIRRVIPIDEIDAAFAVSQNNAVSSDNEKITEREAKEILASLSNKQNNTVSEVGKVETTPGPESQILTREVLAVLLAEFTL